MQDSNATPVLVSACLCGRECRYDGGHADAGSKLARRLAELGARAVPFCPEVEGGLSTPRTPAWIEAHSAEAVLEGTDRVVTGAGMMSQVRSSRAHRHASNCANPRASAAQS
jgi:uncharacterized protein YbbK (DUF523 family)